MSKDKLDKQCPGCRPVMFDAKTRQLLPDDSPQMVIVLKLWDEQSDEVKEAWHRVTCLNSSTPEDRKMFLMFNGLIAQALLKA